ncbi:MAG: nucleoside deaminase [Oscillospiraceae bacterium]|jgi:tRNA(adenine34) deaminase|nr:nucleoside deaminase [Oscillospiraceae bacterium]
MNREEKYMYAALGYANQAASLGEVPVGALIVRGEEIISFGYNLREAGRNGLYHAEMMAIDSACRTLGSWRLSGCELYVTLEPCPMCAGAAINTRISRVIFGAYDKKAGSCGSLLNLLDVKYNHRPRYLGGVLEKQCGEALRAFFKELRGGAKLPLGNFAVKSEE